MADVDSTDERTTSSVTGRLDELADELRTVAGLRSRNAIRDRVFPRLSALLPEDCRNDPERRYAALQQLIETGLADMPDGDHRQAATALLAYGTGRWRPLTKRGAEAAAAFGLGWDAYRRRRESTGSSLVVETLTELAGVLIGEAEPARSPTLLAAPTDTTNAAVAPVHLIRTPSELATTTPHAPAATASKPHRRSVLVGMTVAAAIVAIAASAFVHWSGRTTEPVNCGNLTNAPGDHADGAANELSRWSDAFASVARKLPGGGDSCAGMMSQRDGVVYQEVSAGIGSGVSAILVATDGSGDVIVLDHLEFYRYRAEAWDPETPAPGIGVPVRRADRKNGPRVAEFTNGILVKEDAEVPAVAVVGALWTRWLDEGGFDGELGTPVSNVYDVADLGRVQEFVDGNLVVGYRTGTIDVVHPPPADLALPDGYIGSLLVARGEPGGEKAAWFVDDDGVRHWIPTSNDFGCARLFHNAEQLSDVPQAAISRLPVEEAFRCR